LAAGRVAEIVDGSGPARESSKRQPAKGVARDTDGVRVHPPGQVKDVMPKNLIVLNALLLALAVGGAVYIVRQLMSPMPMPQAGQARPAPPATALAEPPVPPPGGYASVAARNLFSPTRTESPPPPTTASAASPPLKPNPSRLL